MSFRDRLRRCFKGSGRAKHSKRTSIINGGSQSPTQTANIIGPANRSENPNSPQKNSISNCDPSSAGDATVQIRDPTLLDQGVRIAGNLPNETSNTNNSSIKAGSLSSTLLNNTTSTTAPEITVTVHDDFPASGTPTDSLLGRNNYQNLDWGQILEFARKSLTAKEYESVKSKSLSSQPATQGIITAIQQGKDFLAKAERKQLRYRGKKVVEIIRPVLKTIERYGKVVGTAIQHSPEVAALVWAGIELILSVSINYIDSFEGVEDALSKLLTTMANCEYYASIFDDALDITLESDSTTRAFRATVQEAVPKLHAAILVFTVKAEVFFRSTTTRIIPFDVEMKNYIDAITTCEDELEALATKATMGRVQHASRRLEELRDCVGSMQMARDTIAEFLQESRTYQRDKMDEKLNKHYEECLKWLDPTDYEDRLEQVKRSQMEDTCGWILEVPEFLKWHDYTGKKHLWISGKPGVGKTVLTSSIIHWLQGSSTEDDAPIFFFFKEDRPGYSTIPDMLATCISQMMRIESVRPQMITVVKTAYHKRTGNSACRSLKTLCNILGEMAEKLPTRIRFVIDGFDECDTKDRPRLEDLLEVIRLNLYPIHILIASRPEYDIEDRLGKNPDFTHLNMDTRRKLHDIKLYVQRKVEKVPGLKDFKEKICAIVPEKSEGVFQYAVLMMEDLLPSSSGDIDDILNHMPTGLGELYDRILRRLHREYPRLEWLRKIALIFVALKLEDDLSVPQISRAAAVQAWTKSGTEVIETSCDLSKRILATPEKVKEACGCLVQISGDTVLFSHKSVLDFLLGDVRLFHTDTRRYAVDKAEGYKVLFRTTVAQFSTPASHDLWETNPLIHWIQYLHNLLELEGENHDLGFWNDVYSFLNDKQRFQPWMTHFFSCHQQDPPKNFRSIHIVTWLELTPLFDYAIRDLSDADINARYSGSPIPHWTDPRLGLPSSDLPTEESALSLAIRMCNQLERADEGLNNAEHQRSMKIIESLLKAGANPNHGHNIGVAPIQLIFSSSQYSRICCLGMGNMFVGEKNECSICGNRLAELQALLDGGGDPNVILWGRPLLAHALIQDGGHLSLANKLIQTGASTSDPRTLHGVLAWTSQDFNWDVDSHKRVELLMRYQNKSSMEGVSEGPSLRFLLGPLWYGSTEAMLLLLFEYNEQHFLRSPYPDSIRPLSIAARSGRVGGNAIEELIRMEDVNGIDVDGNTALHHVCESKTLFWSSPRLMNLQVRVARLYYRTSKFLSAKKWDNHSLQITTILLNNGFDPRLLNHEGSTPLHLACKAGSIDLVQCLLEHRYVSQYINQHDNSDRTALYIAILSWCSERRLMKWIEEWSTGWPKTENNDNEDDGETYSLLSSCQQEQATRRGLFDLILYWNDHHAMELQTMRFMDGLNVKIAERRGLQWEKLIELLLTHGADMSLACGPNNISAYDLLSNECELDYPEYFKELIGMDNQSRDKQTRPAREVIEREYFTIEGRMKYTKRTSGTWLDKYYMPDKIEFIPDSEEVATKAALHGLDNWFDFWDTDEPLPESNVDTAKNSEVLPSRPCWGPPCQEILRSQSLKGGEKEE